MFRSFTDCVAITHTKMKMKVIRQSFINPQANPHKENSLSHIQTLARPDTDEEKEGNLNGKQELLDTHTPELSDG